MAEELQCVKQATRKAHTAPALCLRWAWTWSLTLVGALYMVTLLHEWHRSRQSCISQQTKESRGHTDIALCFACTFEPYPSYFAFGPSGKRWQDFQLVMCEQCARDTENRKDLQMGVLE